MIHRYLNPLRWNKSLLIGVLAGSAIAWFLLFDTYSLLTRVQLENRKDILIEQTREYREKTQLIEIQIEELEKNPQLIEKIAREDFGMRKPDETVYIVKTEE